LGLLVVFGLGFGLGVVRGFWGGGGCGFWMRGFGLVECFFWGGGLWFRGGGVGFFWAVVGFSALRAKTALDASHNHCTTRKYQKPIVLLKDYTAWEKEGGAVPAYTQRRSEGELLRRKTSRESIKHERRARCRRRVREPRLRLTQGGRHWVRKVHRPGKR